MSEHESVQGLFTKLRDLEVFEAGSETEDMKAWMKPFCFDEKIVVKTKVEFY